MQDGPAISPTAPTTGKVPTRWFDWWPPVLLVAGLGLVYAAYALGQRELVGRSVQEPLAIMLSIAALTLLVIRTAVTRQALYLLLAAVATAVVCREFHWDWTTKAVYIALALIAVWGWLWRDRVFPWLDAHRSVRVWFISTAVMYFMSQAIARRAFRGILPLEAELHIELEEVIENTAHVMLVITALVGPWRPNPTAPDSPPRRTSSRPEPAQ